MKLRWKKNPVETGLISIGKDSKKRGSKLHDGETEYAYVYHHDYSYLAYRVHGKTGCYWVASGDVPYINTCNEPPLTEDEAKAAAMSHVKKHLGLS